jgi:hypothetical protein
MKTITSKILMLAIIGFSGLSLLLPNFAFANSDGWREINWNQTSGDRARGMWHLENWLSDAQRRARNNNHSGNNNDRNDNHRIVNFQSVSQQNNIHIKQSQEVIGDFKSVTMEQKARVYINGKLVVNNEQVLSENAGNKAAQVQEITIHSN